MRSTRLPTGGDHGESPLSGGFAHDVERGGWQGVCPVEQPPGEGAVGEHVPHSGAQPGVEQDGFGAAQSCTPAVRTTAVSSRPTVSVTINRLRALISSQRRIAGLTASEGRHPPGTGPTSEACEQLVH